MYINKRNIDEFLMYKKTIAIHELIRKLNNNKIIFPKYRENYDYKEKSLFIESIMLKMPLTLFYVAENDNDNWEIIDGLQRVKILEDFIVDQSFCLDRLEFLIEHNKIYFGDLSEGYKQRILNTKIDFAILDSTEPVELQNIIYKRVNTNLQ